MAVSDEDVYKAMKEYYSHGSNGVDMLKDKGTAGYKEWGQKEYVKLAKDNPIKFLKKTESTFFIEKEGYALALTDDMVKYIESECFCEHVKDIIELRTLGYYKDRFEKKEK